MNRRELTDAERVIVDSLQEAMEGAPYLGSIAGTYASRIIADPQAHIDALVQAGVLEHCIAIWLTPEGKFEGPALRVVQPHVHEWKVYGRASDLPDSIDVGCTGCPEMVSVSDRLPVEVPAG